MVPFPITSITLSSTGRGFNAFSIDTLLTYLDLPLRADMEMNPENIIKIFTNTVDEIMERKEGLLSLSLENWLFFSKSLIKITEKLIYKKFENESSANKNIKDFLSYINKITLFFNSLENIGLEKESVAAYQAAYSVILHKIMEMYFSNLSPENLSSVSLALIEPQAKLANKKITLLLNYANKLFPFSIAQGEFKQTEESINSCRKAFSVIFNEIGNHKNGLSNLSIESLSDILTTVTKAYIKGVLSENQFIGIFRIVFNELARSSNEGKLKDLPIEKMLIFADALVESKEIYKKSSNLFTSFDNKVEVGSKKTSLLPIIKRRLDTNLSYLNAFLMISNFIFSSRLNSSTTLLVKAAKDDLTKKVSKDFLAMRSSIVEAQNTFAIENLLQQTLEVPLESLKSVERSNQRQTALLEMPQEKQNKLETVQKNLEDFVTSLKKVVQALVFEIASSKKQVTEKEKSSLQVLFRVAETIEFSQEIQKKMKWFEADTAEKNGWFYARSDVNAPKVGKAKAICPA
ncbi:hypothetical protein [Mycoavidus sp. B2-EB]|uniref:hypothetical protein n=1 Tax=Mycoavidus sp. B2-EB TaxID=2651972 RepID=UPI001628ED69|nr:hypothetical protein [Mycoavidus sp. B2-EB]BBO60457.1 hypothetical protein MPB2EB_1598 [Mycoavidus sp. B2-EB]